MRRSKIITIEAEGRDKGRSYLITEMAAEDTEDWATEALLALGRSGVEVDETTMQAGAVAVLSAGLQAFRQMAFADAKPLLAKMFECVSFIPDLTKQDQMTKQPITRPLIGDDIEEVATRLRLRGEVLDLHLGFSVTAALSTLGTAARAASSGIRTSRKSSARSSARAKPR